MDVAGVLAVAYFVTVAFSLLPGSAFLRKPEIDWRGPHAYVMVARAAIILALAIYALPS